MQAANVSSSTTQTVERKHAHPSNILPVSNARRRMAQQVPMSAPQVLPTRQDPFYGHESIARLCTRFITHLFACPKYPPAATHSQAELPHFIAYALYRTKLHPSVTFASLVLLRRLKARFPTARGSSGHRLFISAFMIASKVICDDTYSNKSWSIATQKMFNLREVNQMERELCNYLDWELTVDNPILSNFETAVRRDFAQDHGQYPDYPLTKVSKRAAHADASTAATTVPEPSDITTAVPGFGQYRQSPSTTRPDSSQKSSSKRWKAPHSDPNTPSPSHSSTTSPASSASPQTPLNLETVRARIHGIDASPPFTFVSDAPSVHPLKGQMFAFALPSKY
ncbi:hypothetical protein DFP72DRAFT_909176 [Ephemerocybe angulata]|uniref:Cyclin N-terminal domain-containing protein n=1 Tax=Ephemerocybe angulata TaxID=980116 RepID=A0A8H6HPZ6_9AGAR|nr:hypothetical protein DFP72DRAFT_909176 [Tulosesus angulatus]